MMTNRQESCIIKHGFLSFEGLLRSKAHFYVNSSENSFFGRTHLMKSNYSRKSRFIGLLFILSTLAVNVTAQSTLAKEMEIIASAGDRWWYTMIFIVSSCFAVAFYLWRKSKKGADQPQFNYSSRYADYYGHKSYDIERGVDAEKELELLRKAEKPAAKSNNTAAATKSPGGTTKISSIMGNPAADAMQIDTKIFQEKMRKLQYARLPINSFHELSPAKQYDQLPISNDLSLMNAIEQANEEFEEDEEVRDLAVRILTAFRKKNSVEALAQIAIYDLSSNLRSKAVSTLTDFDHESVFETILLACADPTREVRAAAARGLFRLNFDRADAWKRIIETKDEFHMTHAARAAIESGIVLKSFDRLVHEDLKVAYEAFTLVALLIKSGETKEIFESIRSHKDERVRLALLHVLKAIKDDRTLAGLNELYKNEHFPTDVAVKVKDLILSFEHVPA